MTEKEYADYLIDSFSSVANQDTECALICVEEILREWQSVSDLKSHIHFNRKDSSVVNRLIYWNGVKDKLKRYNG